MHAVQHKRPMMDTLQIGKSFARGGLPFTECGHLSSGNRRAGERLAVGATLHECLSVKAFPAFWLVSVGAKNSACRMAYP
jgi:hypothetical protein